MKHISVLRKEYGWTQAELANKLNISQQAVSKYEKGERDPDIDVLLRIANIFNVSTDYLLGLSEQRFPDEDLEWRYPHVENRLGNILNKYRKTNHLSEVTFASQLEIDEDLLSKIELGIYSPTLKLIKKISEITGYDIDYLTGAKSSTSALTEPGTIKEGYSTVFVESDYHFQSRLEEQCLKNCITDDNVTERLGLSKQDFLDIKWNRMPTLSELLRISYGLGVSIDYLIGKTDTPIFNLSSDELDLLLNYRDCIDSYKENLLKRAEKLSIESIGVSSITQNSNSKCIDSSDKYFSSNSSEKLKRKSIEEGVAAPSWSQRQAK